MTNISVISHTLVTRNTWATVCLLDWVRIVRAPRALSLLTIKLLAVKPLKSRRAI